MQLPIPVKAVDRLKSFFVKPNQTVVVQPVKAKKKNPLKSIMDNPQDYKLEIYFEDDELVVKVKPKSKPKYRLRTDSRKNRAL